MLGDKVGEEKKNKDVLTNNIKRKEQYI